MIAGGIKYRQLRFNPIATGASGSLLLISVIGACVPTVRLLTLVSSRPQIFYSVYANYDLNCAECSAAFNSTEEWDVSCTECSYQEATKEGSVYNDLARPLSWFCACLLPIAYIIGCLFTLKTHSCIYFCCFFKKSPWQLCMINSTLRSTTELKKIQQRKSVCVFTVTVKVKVGMKKRTGVE